MRFVFLRHAEREFSMHGDPALSDEGQTQAHSLFEDIENKKLPPPIQLISSPKKRCQQTLAVIGRELKLEIVTEPKLDEQNAQERLGEFRQRINSFSENSARSLCARNSGHEGAIYVCTHSDWLQEAVSVLPEKEGKLSDIYHFPCAKPLILEFENDFWKLIKTL